MTVQTPQTFAQTFDRNEHRFEFGSVGELQITVRRHADELALRLARILEKARPWPRLAPGYR